MRLVWLALVVVVAAVGWGQAPSGADTAKALLARSQAETAHASRKVLAFYYPWYGNPATSGKWVHWEGVNTVKRDITSSTHYPVLGPYDSHDPKTVKRHCEWAKRAGIDGFLSSWWGKGDFSDQALPLLLDTARASGLTVTIYYEQVPKPGDPESAVRDFLYLTERYGGHPAFQKIGGRPVFFVYGRAMGQLSLAQWAWVIEEVERRRKPGAMFIADDLAARTARVFDGLHTYNTCGTLARHGPEEVGRLMHQVFDDAMAETKARGRIGCVTVIPGYDDTKIRKPGIVAERHDGSSYERQWREAMKLDPDWVLITSFNEWHEGSEIEPSDEYGEKYLDLTARLAKDFHALKRR